MKLIAHRGNINGPNSALENAPSYIDQAIKLGFNVEIDIRYIESKFYLGHDEPQYEVSMSWLVERNNFLWIHCKDLRSLEVFSNSLINFNCFWHESDQYTLTSSGYIWSSPNQSYNFNSVIVMPEVSDLIKFDDSGNIIDMSNYNCFAVCSDYVSRIK